MTMHLHHPALSLSGKKKGKKKFATSAAKQRQIELAKSWQENMKQWESMSLRNSTKSKSAMTQSKSISLSPKIPQDRNTRHLPSIDTGVRGAVSSKPSQMYTGSNVIGISLEHKSRLVPVFSAEQAEDIARMRR